MIECISTALDNEENQENDDYKEFLVDLLTKKRFPNKISKSSNIKEYAAMLFTDKRKRRRNQKQVCETFAAWSWSNIAALYNEFLNLENNNENKSLPDAIDEMFENNNDVGDALCVIIEFCRNPYNFWAKKIKDSMAGTGT